MPRGRNQLKTYDVRALGSGFRALLSLCFLSLSIVLSLPQAFHGVVLSGTLS
jgi:hypothetical protein